jgi:hypothetical protein
MIKEEKKPIDEKLDAIKYCMVNGHEEDFEQHIFDLLRSARVKDLPDHELTSEGIYLKSLWK